MLPRLEELLHSKGLLHNVVGSIPGDSPWVESNLEKVCLLLLLMK